MGSLLVEMKSSRRKNEYDKLAKREPSRSIEGQQKETAKKEALRGGESSAQLTRKLNIRETLVSEKYGFISSAC